MQERDKKTSKPGPGTPPPAEDDSIQGEGDYAATRRFRERTERFLESADVDELAHKAAPKSKAEADQMKQAEEEGRSRRHLPKGQDGEADDGAST